MEQNNIFVIQGEAEKNRGVRYEIDTTRDPIGKGGTGVVRAGQMIDERTGVRRDVAIKFLYDDMPENILVRSQREASIRVLSENLVEMIDFVQINEQDAQGRTIVHSHVVSELLHGVMLLDILKGVTTDKDGNEVQAAREYLELMQTDRTQFAIKIVRNVLSGIQALHDNGYIHRDIDPSNIMITDRGKVKLIDLGIAKQLSSSPIGGDEGGHLTSTGQFIGKAAYAAPELVLGDLANQNETTDIYAIGVMLYLLVVGKLPFNGPLQEILFMQCNEQMPVQDIQDKTISDIVKTATEKRQSERYQSASEFRVAIDAVSRKLSTAAAPKPAAAPVPAPTPTSTPEPAPEPVQQTKKSNTLLYIIAAVAAVAIIGAAVFFLSGSSSSSSAEGGEEPEPVQTEQTESATPVSEAPAVQESSPAVADAPAPVETSAPAETPKAAKTTDSQPAKESAPSPAPKTEQQAPKSESKASQGGLSLSYGKYTGAVKNGYPNGKGKLVYTTSRRINKYDSKGIVAQPGEYVEGMFVNGFLTVGKHYSASGELLNKISVGVAEGVYEAK